MTFRSSAEEPSATARRALHSGLPLLPPAALAVLLGCSGGHSGAPAAAQPAAAPPAASSSPPSPPAHRPPPRLTAEIGFSHAQSLFRVENDDSFPWSNCEFILNAHEATPRYTVTIASVKSGFKETAMLRAGDFQDTAGRKFDPAAGRVATLDFGCDTPRGRLRAEQFLLGETSGPSGPGPRGPQ